MRGRPRPDQVTSCHHGKDLRSFSRSAGKSLEGFDGGATWSQLYFQRNHPDSLAENRPQGTKSGGKMTSKEADAARKQVRVRDEGGVDKGGIGGSGKRRSDSAC